SGGFRTFLRNVRSPLRRRIFVAYMLVTAFSAFALMAYVSASSFVVQEMLGFTSTEYSVRFAINSMGMMTMSLLSARLTRTIHPRKLIRVGLIAVSLASLSLLIGSLLLAPPPGVVLPPLVFTVAPPGMIFRNGGALASDQAREFAGTGSAMLGLGFSFSASVAAPLVGIAGTHSSLPMAIAMVCGVLICGTFFVLAGRGSGADTG